MIRLKWYTFIQFIPLIWFCSFNQSFWGCCNCLHINQMMVIINLLMFVTWKINHVSTDVDSVSLICLGCTLTPMYNVSWWEEVLVMAPALTPSYYVNVCPKSAGTCRLVFVVGSCVSFFFADRFVIIRPLAFSFVLLHIFHVRVFYSYTVCVFSIYEGRTVANNGLDLLHLNFSV